MIFSILLALSLVPMKVVITHYPAQVQQPPEIAYVYAGDFDLVAEDGESFTFEGELWLAIHPGEDLPLIFAYPSAPVVVDRQPMDIVKIDDLTWTVHVGEVWLIAKKLKTRYAGSIRIIHEGVTVITTKLVGATDEEMIGRAALLALEGTLENNYQP